MFLGSFVSYIFISLGFICLIIPGIFLMKRYMYVLNIAEEEMLGPLNSMRKSKELSKKNGWSTVLALILTGIPFYILYLPIMFLTNPAITSSASYLSFSLGTIIFSWFSYVAFSFAIFSGYKQAQASVNREG